MMERRPERIDIAPRIGDALVLLRRRITFGPDHRAPLLRREGACNTEVDKHERLILGSDHDVARLQIAENDWLWFLKVKVVQDTAEIDRPIDDLLFVERLSTLAQNRFQVVAVDELENKVNRALML